MKQWTPLVTAVLVGLGLIGFLVFNATQTVEDNAPAAAPAVTGTTTPAPTTETSVPAFPAEAVYAGRAEGTKLAVAIAIKGGKAAGYLCDGARIEAWLKGTAKNGRVELRSSDGTAVVTAELDGDSLSGTAEAEGRGFGFTLEPAEPPAGLYRGADGATTIGWIVLPDGSQVGIARTGSEPSPAPPLNPEQGTAIVEDRSVTASAVSGETTF